MNKLKGLVSAKVEHDYFHSTYEEPVVYLNKQKTKEALLELKRKKSLTHGR